jgi:acetyl-CoA C-acetyltransferase
VITAGNASKLSDGACSLLLMSEAEVKRRKLQPLARIVAQADSEISPNDFCIAPNSSIKKALERAGLSLGQIDFLEINEAFAVAALANMKLLDVPLERINIWGGAIALGHPIGMSGARILGTLAQILINKKGKYGVAAICNGGGGSSAVVIENVA